MTSRRIATSTMHPKVLGYKLDLQQYEIDFHHCGRTRSLRGSKGKSKGTSQAGQVQLMLKYFLASSCSILHCLLQMKWTIKAHSFLPPLLAARQSYQRRLHMPEATIYLKARGSLRHGLW